ncbi:MAG TPA: hypothetical protein VKR58_02150 [Aquella sp.]|nr:hypothetical protein [Aquella sp.]
MTTSEVAKSLNKFKWYQKKDETPITALQIHGRSKNYPQLFNRDGSIVSLVRQEGNKLLKPTPYHKSRPKLTIRTMKDEQYVLDLCDKILNLASSRQHRFDFLVGDKNAKGNAVKLPVDAYYEKLKLVIEYRELQHTESVRFFDKPDRLTVSGIHRGEQREKYDERRRITIPKNGLTLVEISYSDFKHDRYKKIIRDLKHETKTLRNILRSYI